MLCRRSSRQVGPDIVDFIIRQGCDIQSNLEELYRRVAFSIVIGNSDDHFRNHGFLLSRKGWRLSPAYDINPTTDDHLSLLINGHTNEADLKILQQSSSKYLIQPEHAESIISEVKAAMQGWKKNATSIGIHQRDIDIFAPRINSYLC